MHERKANNLTIWVGLCFLLLASACGGSGGGDGADVASIQDARESLAPLDLVEVKPGEDALDVLVPMDGVPDISPEDGWETVLPADLVDVPGLPDTGIDSQELDLPELSDSLRPPDAEEDAEVLEPQDAVDVDATPPVNACGGTSVLAQDPGEPCGPCGLDSWSCNGPDAVVCSGETWGNGCDHCDSEIPCGLPPDPEDVAPVPLPGQVVSFTESVSFLYQGDDPIQKDVEDLDPDGLGVLRGRVVREGGVPLPGMVVSVLHDEGVGWTLTRADGRFDLAVNGGKEVVVHFEGEGFLPAQRRVFPRTGGYTSLPEVVMVALDPVHTVVSFGALSPVQVAIGSPVSDEDGDRTGVLLFPEGTNAEVVASDGTSVTLPGGSVRITEYTVGPDGPERMPAALPSSSGYTYAMELSLDEALSWESSVRFDRPLSYYVDNFLHFPVGTVVPFASYNRSRGLWEPEPNGKVISILEVVDGKAQIDANGDGWGESSTTLAAMGFDDAELQQLAGLYAVGTELWRVRVSHFTPFDCNWPIAPDDGAQRPNNRRPGRDRRKGDPCEEDNSIIACENQALGECVPVTGTPYQLCYWSDRVPGRTAAYTLDIQLTGADVPEPLQRVELEVEVEGQVYRETFGAGPNQTTTYTWDGLDAYGRRAGRTTVARVRIGYVYNGNYQPTPPTDPSFAAWDPDVDILVDGARLEVTFWQEFQEDLGVQEQGGLGPPGWSLSAYHSYDPSRRIITSGSGGTRDLSQPVFSIVGGTGHPGDPFDFLGQPAVDASLRANMQDLSVGADGTVYLLYESSMMPGLGAVVFRITPDGILEKYAGGGASGTLGDGGPAVDARINSAWSIDVTQDGGLLIAEPYRLRKVDADGIITTLGGTGSSTGTIQEEVPAISTKLIVQDAAEGPDGTIYVLGPSQIRTIDSDGILHAFAGGGSQSWANGAVARREEAAFQQLWDFDIAPDGTIFVGAGAYTDRAAVISTDGLVSHLAGGGSLLADGALATDSAGNMARVAAGPGGVVLVGDLDNKLVRLVDKAGTVWTFAGGGTQDVLEGIRADDVELTNAMHLAVGPGGDVYLTYWYQVLKVQSPVRFVDDRYLVPSRDGTRVYEFDEDGRHLGTRDALLDTELLSFEVDGDGLLSAVTDPYGNVTTIERNAAGEVTAIIASNGQETLLSVDGDGDLAAITDPSGGAVSFTYLDGSLMQTRTDPNGGWHQYSYDARGRLHTDTNPDGGTQTLTRTDSENGQTVTLTSSTGRTSSYGLEWNEDGTTTWTFRDEAGGETVVVTDEDGNQTATYPNGRTMSVTFAPDPRWGDLVPYFSSAITTTPAGVVQEVSAVKEAELSDPGNPLSVVVETHTIDLNGRTFTRSFDAGTRSLTRTSPEGRQMQIVADVDGRVSQVIEDPSSHAAQFGYDAFGRLSEYGRGTRIYNLGYDEFSRVETFGNSEGEGQAYEWTDDNHLSLWTAPDLGVHSFEWEDGIRLAVVRPDGDLHGFAHTDKGLEESYLPPAAATPYRWTYDGDGALVSMVAPSGRSVTWTFTGMPFPTRIDHDKAVVELSQFGTSGQPGIMVRTPTVGLAQSLSWDWDGGLLTGLTLVGAAEGVFAYGWDSSFQLSSLAFSAAAGSHSLSLGRDDDGLLTSLGSMVVTRGGPAGAPNTMSDGTLAVTFGYDAYGLLETRSHSVGSTGFYELGVVRDDAGRIVERTETLDGVTVVSSYTWDVNGRLLSVLRDGLPWEDYSWDASDNRLSASVDGLDIAATYADADRILTSGSTVYEVDSDGFVAQKGDMLLSWSSRGELLEAELSGQQIGYSYDGYSRLTARTDAGGSVEYFRGNPSDPLQVTHVVDGGQLTVLLYDEAGLLTSLTRGGTTYYVACDQVGTPRIVVDDSGTVIKVVDRDSWGNLISDSNPAFGLPVGFAGGIEDPDTGLVHFGFRTYDPEAGRWLALDPLLFDGGQANLYLYAHGDPVDLVDPSGLFCIGGSYYMGVGAGGSVCMTSEGVSYCAETGFGIGGGVSADVFGDLQRDGTYFGASVSADDGLVGTGLTWELDDCGRNNVSWDCKVGWVTCSFSGRSIDDAEFDVNLPLYDPEDLGLPELPKMKANLEAKVYGKACASYRW